jgi:hypothetical protein
VCGSDPWSCIAATMPPATGRLVVTQAFRAEEVEILTKALV